MKLLSKLTLPILLIAVFIAVIVIYRHNVMYQVMQLAQGEPPPLVDSNESANWFDDYYTLEVIAPGTWAIGEPRYYQQNYNYLIVGTERAVLFDAGAGVRDINPVIKSLTNLPVVFLPSHFHYDHVGNNVQFNSRAVVDLPYLRERANGDVLTLQDMEHLGPVEGFEIPTWTVDHWWKPGEPIDLGERTVTILHTPGHSPESISIWDEMNNVVLSGDYLYPGPLFAFVPGSSARQYLQSADHLLSIDNPETKYYGAHRSAPPGPPLLSSGDVEDLQSVLINMRAGRASGEGLWPVSYPVNERLTLMADPEFLQDWE